MAVENMHAFRDGYVVSSGYSCISAGRIFQIPKNINFSFDCQAFRSVDEGILLMKAVFTLKTTIPPLAVNDSAFAVYKSRMSQHPRIIAMDSDFSSA